MATMDPVPLWLHHNAVQCDLAHEVAFEIDHRLLQIRSNSTDLINRARECFAYYPLQGVQGTAPGAATRIEIYCIGHRSGPMGLRPGDPWHATFLQSADDIKALSAPQKGLLHATDGKYHCLWKPFDTMVSFACSGRGGIRILVGDPVDPNQKLPAVRIRTHNPLAFPANGVEIMDLVKALFIQDCGLFCIHGAAVMLEGSGMLFTGPSGAGKTTTALALARDGFSLLSDELTTIDSKHGEKSIISGLLMPPSMVGRAPVSMADIEATLTSPADAGKGSICLPEKMIDAGRNQSAPLEAIFFIEQGMPPRPEHQCLRISAQEAFVLITDQALDLSSAFRCRERMETLLTLVDQCPCYRLTLGRDLKTIPGLIRSLFQKTTGRETMKIATAFYDDARPAVRIHGLGIASQLPHAQSDHLLFKAMEDGDETVWQIALENIAARYPWLSLIPNSAGRVPKEALNSHWGRQWISFRSGLKAWIKDRPAQKGPLPASRWQRLPGAIPDLTEILAHYGHRKEAEDLEQASNLSQNNPTENRQLLVAPTYACNLDCSYCYAKGWNDLFNGAMSAQNLELLFSWCAHQDINRIILGGGEPTVYEHLPRLLAMADERRIKVSLTSNMLFPKSVQRTLGSGCIDEVIAHFDQSLIHRSQMNSRFHENLAALATEDRKRFIRYTLTPESTRDEWHHVIAAAHIHGVETINYAFAFGSFLQNNQSFPIIGDQQKELFQLTFDQFAGDCRQAGLGMLLCKPLPLCCFSEENLKRYLHQGLLRSACAAHLRNCTQNVTVNPDLTLFPCNAIAVKGLRLTDCMNLDAVAARFSPLVHELLSLPYTEVCRTCLFFYRGFCQGACLAEKFKLLPESNCYDVFKG